MLRSKTGPIPLTFKPRTGWKPHLSASDWNKWQLFTIRLEIRFWTVKGLSVEVPHVKELPQTWTSYVSVTWVPVVLSQTDPLMISMGVTCIANQYCRPWINGVLIYDVWYTNIRNNNLAVHSSELVTYIRDAGCFTVYIISLLHSFSEQRLWPGKHLFLAKLCIFTTENLKNIVPLMSPQDSLAVKHIFIIASHSVQL